MEVNSHIIKTCLMKYYRLKRLTVEKSNKEVGYTGEVPNKGWN